MSLTPLEVFAQSQNNANILNNTNFDVVAAEQRREVIDQVNAEPSLILTDSRNFYIVGDVPTGTAPWTANAKKLALWRGSAWFFWTPARNQIYAKPDGTEFQWNGTDWITPGGGGATPLSGLITLDGNQTTSLAGNDPVQFEIQDAAGDLDFDDVNFQVTLQADVKVKLEASLLVNFSGGGRLDYQWYDVTNAAFIGIRSIQYAINRGAAESTQPVATAHLTPVTDVIVELRVSSPDLVDYVDATYSYGYIQEII